MPLSHVVVLAALQGLTEALPISRSGHGVAARLFLDPAGGGGRLDAVVHLGTALALALAARARILAALAEGVRAIARPGLFRASPAAHDAAVMTAGAAVSLVAGAIVAPRVELWSESPLAAGAGLVVSGLALASTALARRPAGPARLQPGEGGPSVIGAVIVGVAHGLAAFPGASRVGAALTVLLWLGVRPGKAVDLAFAITIPTLVVAFARSAAGGLDTGTAVMGLVLAFLAALVASVLLRALADRRRVAALALWTIPLGLAMLAYAHALPHAG